MRLALSLSALSLFLLAGCDSAGPPSDEAPALISPEAFTFDAGTFFAASGLDGPTDVPGGAARSASALSHFVAAARVGIVTGVVGLHLVIPKVATDAATAVEPVVENGAFVWANTVEVLGQTIDLRLSGAPRGSGVDWTLTTASGGQPPFTVYTATTTPDGRSGTWTLFSPDVSGAVLTADFDVDDTPEFAFRVPSGQPRAGSSVRYAKDGDEATFEFVDTEAGAQTLIRWSLANRSGFIEATDFNGSARACWDASLQDVACPGV